MKKGTWKKGVLCLGVLLTLVGCGQEKKKTEIHTKEDLKGKLVGVQLGTTSDLEASKPEYGVKEVKRFSKSAEAIKAMKVGQIDCVLLDSQPAKKFVKKDNTITILPEKFIQEEYAICLAKDNQKLLKKMEKALEEIKEDGTLQTIVDSYDKTNREVKGYKTAKGTKHDNGTLVMATNAEFEPYEFHEGDGIVGIDVDVARAICDRLGYELQVMDMEFDSIIPAVQSKKADFGMAGLTVTKEREKNVAFTKTYADASQVMIVNR